MSIFNGSQKHENSSTILRNVATKYAKVAKKNKFLKINTKK